LRHGEFVFLSSPSPQIPAHFFWLNLNRFG
jgi:hypothetical protein